MATLGYLFGLAEVRELPGAFILEALQALGLTAAGARSFVTRAVKEGRLASHRRGRASSYALAGAYLQRFDAVERRFGAAPAWEGFFHAVIYDLPEVRRSERDALRHAAFAQGWGCPRPGLLVGLEQAGAWARDCWRGELTVDLATARQMAAAAWDLDGAAARVRRAATALLEANRSGGQAPMETGASRGSWSRWEPVVRAHDLLCEATFLWGLVPPVPRELLPEDFPSAELERVHEALSGPVMTAGVSAARRILQEYESGHGRA